MYEGSVLLDSVSPDGVRATTFLIRMPTRVLAEFNTHRMLSRCSSSTRARKLFRGRPRKPNEAPTVVEEVTESPYIPEWGVEEKGMQSRLAADPEQAKRATASYLAARDEALMRAFDLHKLGVHRQDITPLLTPFSWTQTVATGTDWSNYFALRTHEDAHPAIRRVARMMYLSYIDSIPQYIGYGDWHLPFVTAADREELDDYADAINVLKRVSAGRCARTSYLTPVGRVEIDSDLDLARRLERTDPKHASPFEHQMTPLRGTGFTPDSANYRGWKSFRKELANESVQSFRVPAEMVARWRRELGAFDSASAGG